MKKFLLLIMCLYAGASAYAQMATKMEAGNDGVERLISNDERKIHFGSVAKKLYADLNPATHSQDGSFGMGVVTSGDFAGYHDGNDNLQNATCNYTYDNGVGTFSYRNVFWGNAAVNLLDKLEGKLGDYENFVIRTLSVTSPREGQNVTIRIGSGEPHDYPQAARYAVQFCDKNNAVIREAIIYSNDVKVIHLKEFFTPQQIQEINSVFISTCGANTFLDADVQIAEAYFISAYNMNDENYFKDMDGNYIGNAYIHPSYFICSNNVTLDEATGVITVGEPGAQSYQSWTLDTSMFKSWNGVGADATSTGDANCEYVINESNGNIYGNSSVNYHEYADLSNYDRLTIVTNAETEAPRLLFNAQNAQDPKGCLEVVPGSSYLSQNGDNKKMFYVDLAAIKAAAGYAHLNAIKGANWQPITVSSMIVEKLNAVKSPASLQLSVPFEGFDMRDITVVTFDNEEDGDVIWRNIYGNKNYNKLGHVRKGADKRTQAAGSRDHEIDLANENEDCHDVRTLYTSRYNADFQNDQINPSYADKINNIYWETNYSGTTNPIGTMTVNDICFTKNHVVVRNGGNHTLLSADLFNTQDIDNKALYEQRNGAGQFLLGGLSGDKYADLSKYYKMQIKGTPGKEIVFLANCPIGESIGYGGSNFRETLVRLDSKGLANVDIAEFVKKDGAYRLNLVSTSNNNSGETKLDYIKLYADEDGIVELNEDLYHSWNRAENGTVTRLEAFGGNTHGNNHHLVNRIGTQVEANSNGTTLFGHDYNFYKEDYAELTGYKAIKVTGTPGKTVRFIYNCSKNKTNTANSEQKDQYVTIGEDGTAKMDIRDYVYFHLNGIKTYDAIKVDKVELISDERVDYVLEGNGTLSKTDDDAKAYAVGGKNGNIGTNAMAALNDVGARVFDARPRVSISRTSIAYPANPNSLIIMRKNLSRGQSGRVQFDTPSKDGVAANMLTFDGLTSDDYKITQAKVNNLQLFDGYPFSAPRNFDVETAKLTRKTTANVVGTLILPFASSELNGTAYKTFGAEYAEYDTEKQGILGNVDINKGDHVLKFEATTSAAPYQPYLYVASATADNTEFVSASKLIAKTPETYNDQIELMTNQTDASATPEDLHYLRGFMESTHVENVYAYTAAGKLIAATNATMNPFRVLIQAPKNISEDRQAQATSAPVKVVLASVFDDADVTAIESVETLDPERNVDVFSVNGALVKKNVKAADALQSLPKGVYVVGGKKIVK